jgi:GT2 family glycosyltransferase
VHPALAIVIVTHNSAAVVGRLLDGLPAAVAGLEADVVVVDNASSDDTVAVVESRGVPVLHCTNAGYAAGVNRGVAHCSSASMVLVLNPDVELDAGCVPTMVGALARPSVGIVAPLVREADGSLSCSLRREPTLARALGLGRTEHPALSEAVTSPRDYDHGHAVDWAVGATLLFSRECYDAVGGWDESFFLYSEETDFCLRARDLGFLTWYEPAATTMHIGGASGVSTATHCMQVTNRVRLYSRRHGSFASSAYFVLAVLSELSWWARGNPYSLAAVRALLLPSRRPRELRASRGLLPR